MHCPLVSHHSIWSSSKWAVGREQVGSLPKISACVEGLYEAMVESHSHPCAMKEKGRKGGKEGRKTSSSYQTSDVRTAL